MVVDENRDEGLVLAHLLGSTGYKVLMHESAQSALADARLADTKVFILNIGMPAVNEYELARRLR